MKYTQRLKGFTLIELIVVIGIITILAAIVIIAVNPSRQFALARNTQRRSDVLAILDAVHQYAADNNGSLPGGIPVVATCATATTSTVDVGSTSFSPPAASQLAAVTGPVTGQVFVPTYLTAIPQDPSGGTSSVTKYNICQTASGQVTVWATGAEQSATIKVSR